MSFRPMIRPVKNEPESMYSDKSDSQRDAILPEDLLVPTSLPRILLVDDDPTYGKIMERAATQHGVELTYCRDLEEFGALKSWNYDVVVIDYDLGSVTGFELTVYLEHHTEAETPV